MSAEPCPCCAPPWQLKANVRPAFCTVKCYNHSGSLLWIGDQFQTVTGLAVDDNGNAYTCFGGSPYNANISSFNIVEKRNSDGLLTAAIPGQKLSAPELGVGHFKSTAGLRIASSPAGIYFIRQTNGDTGGATSDPNRVDKYSSSLDFSLTMPQTNGSSSFTATLPMTHIGARGTLVAITALSGSTQHAVAAWTNDLLNNVIAAGVRPAGSSTTGLEMGNAGQIYVSHSNGSSSFSTWSSSPVITSQTGAIPLWGIAVSGSSVFGLHLNGTPITGITRKGGTGGINWKIGANESGAYAIADDTPPKPTLRFFDSSNNLIWSDPWGNNSTDYINEIVVTSDRVYAAGVRVQLL